MKVINYKCTLCDNIWEPDLVFGVHVDENGQVTLVDPEEEDKHVCRNCIVGIKGFLDNEN